MNRSSKIKIVEEFTSADFVFEACGDDLNDLFENCAYACFIAMTDPDSVLPNLEFKLELAGENIDELLYNFVSELIYIKDTEKVFLSSFNVDIDVDKAALKAVVRGEKIDYNRHCIKTDVKAATFHGLNVKRLDGGYAVRMILDL